MTFPLSGFEQRFRFPEPIKAEPDVFEPKVHGLNMRRNTLPFFTAALVGTFFFVFYLWLYPGDGYFSQAQKVVNKLEFDIEKGPKCPKTHGIDFLVFILSIFKNVHKRNTIRATWGSVARTGEWPSRDFHSSVKIVFLLGHYEDYFIRDEIKYEVDTYGDILQIKCEDSYDMPTWKILTGFKWMEQSCSNTRYVVKSDDDVFLNLPVVEEVLRRETGPAMYGDRLIISTTHRTGKHRVSFQSYPFILYPSYLIGYTYFMPYSVATKVLKASYYVPQHSKYEDVYLTGMLSKATGTQLKQLQPSWISLNKNVQLCDFVNTKLVSAGDLDVKMISSFWQTFTNASICT